ncbi:hypothetical protein HZF08_29915 [Paenibacillus sp. CGMCC 1.16610]|uniref:Zf-HC2 domain-containing protein n=1 Tax=Paenibacillus anseongense TaxID=2682845 RepID=A0ABW9U883_9BACL|nr:MULTISPECIES: hypothetical protein [Paenibacillus]MBA2942496.1 hypothetical protein [Paenibacillus sp. CGMCC 1.16610]MVQ34570.1 hypothetical protein [Paenibacillus anseongense]
MKHYDEHAWGLYINQQLPPHGISEMEHHLYRCDECLDRYMICMEQMTIILPVLEADERTFVDAVLARTLGTKRSWYHSTILHYGIAAAATLILVATGFFHGLSQELGPRGALQPAPPPEMKMDQPISDRLLNKTLIWLDTLQNK